jgi:hypothetical protein
LARRSQLLEPGARAGYGRLVGILGYGCHARLSPSQDDPAVEHRVSRSLPRSALSRAAPPAQTFSDWRVA